MTIEPQQGKQEEFLTTKADIAIYGGAAGSGKSFAMVLEPIRHYENPDFRGVIFRRTMPEIKAGGGLWDASGKVYPLLGAKPNESELTWKFPVGMKMKYTHLQYEKDKYDHQGAEYAFIGFDELTHFSQSQFFYLLSRLRSMSGVSGYIRATCNPDPDSWVKDFIEWWLDPETGLPIPERSGVLRYFLRVNDEIIWDSSRRELEKKYGKNCQPKTVTFISANIYDNKILLENDPAYLSNLKALPRVEREQLLGGNWNVRAAAGMVFRKEDFEIVDAAPADLRLVRWWDRAATEPSTSNPDPDWTVGLLIGIDRVGIYYVLDMVRERKSAHKIEAIIKNTASQDGKLCTVGMFQDPGSAGKAEAEYMVRELKGYIVEINKINVDKVTAAKPASSQSEAGNIKLVRGTWNKAFLNEAHNFPDDDHDDVVDTLSGGVNFFGSKSVGLFKGHQAGKRLENTKKKSNVEKRIKVRDF